MANNQSLGYDIGFIDKLSNGYKIGLNLDAENFNYALAFHDVTNHFYEFMTSINRLPYFEITRTDKPNLPIVTHDPEDLYRDPVEISGQSGAKLYFSIEIDDNDYIRIKSVTRVVSINEALDEYAKNVLGFEEIN